jgi:hypothetical protein
MTRYKIWDHTEPVRTPDGTVFTAEEWKARHHISDNETIVLSGSEINGGFCERFGHMKEVYRQAGCEISDTASPDETLERISEYEASPPERGESDLDRQLAAAELPQALAYAETIQSTEDLSVRISLLHQANRVLQKHYINPENWQVDRYVHYAAVGDLLEAGQKLLYKGKIYRVRCHCLKSRTKRPDLDTEFFREVKTQGGYLEWVSPAGPDDAYNFGDKVIYNGFVWRNDHPGIRTNTLPPGTADSGWTQLYPLPD